MLRYPENIGATIRWQREKSKGNTMNPCRTAMSTFASAVVIGVLAIPNSAIADGNCASITGTSVTQMTGNPDWPTTEPFAWFTGTASVQIDGGQALSLSVFGEVTNVVLPAEDDFDTAPTAWVSATFELAGAGGFAAQGEIVVTLPEVSDMDMLFPVGATLTISDGTGDFQGVSGTIISNGPNDFLTGVGTLELNGDICLRTVCHVPPGEPENAHTIRIGAAAVSTHLEHGDYLGPCVTGGGAVPKRVQDETNAQSNGTIACGAFSPALLLFGFVGMRLMRSRRSST